MSTSNPRIHQMMRRPVLKKPTSPAGPDSLNSIKRSMPRMSGWLARGAAFSALGLLGGCNMVLMDPKGAIGVQEKHLILVALGLMLLVVIPLILLTLFFAWKYRASNTRATYAPEWAHSNAIEVVVWGVPCAIVVVLAVLIWQTTHTL